MVVGIGIDLVKIKRIESVCRKWKKRFLERIFTQTEQDYSFSFRRPYPHLAGRFAVKEAVFKAIGTGWRKGVRWTDVEVYNESSGQPHVRVHGKVRDWVEDHGVTEIQVSLSHDTDYSIGQVVLIQSETKP
jgi:holo-[acyl-carrier protein] synthase